MSKSINLFVCVILSLLCPVLSRRNLSEIRYHFTPCGKTGRSGPSYEECMQYYTSIDSPIIRDGVLTDAHSSVFVGSQSFRPPKETLYNLTIAGAAGGRGICNIEYGRGLVIHTNVTLVATTDYLILVGQRGLGPCDSGQPDSGGHQLCLNPPQDIESCDICGRTYVLWLLEGHTNFAAFMRALNTSGGAGGGGASFVGFRDIRNEGDVRVYGLPGGGGGSSSLLDYSVVRTLQENEDISLNDSNLYRHLVNAKVSYSDPELADNSGFRGYRIETAPDMVIAGAGGGIFSSTRFSSHQHDGRAVGRIADFALGGTHCARNDFSLLPLDLRGGDGGFGGGGGGCGGGGGGGGFTGGPILGTSYTTPGGGGYTLSLEYLTLNSQLESYPSSDSSFNDGDGYVDIVAADCGCVYECVVYEEEDQFECLCPNNAQLATDLSDCYFAETRKVEYSEWTVDSDNVYKLSLVNLGNSTNIFSISTVLGPSVYSYGSGSGSGDNDEWMLEPSEGSDGVCAIAFIGAEEEIVLVSDPVQGGQVVSRLSQIEVNFTEGSVHMSEFTGFLSSPVLVTGAILVSQGDCFIQGGLSLNISIQEPTANILERDTMFDYPKLRAEILENPNVTTSVLMHLLQYEEDTASGDDNSTVTTVTITESNALELEYVIAISVAVVVLVAAVFILLRLCTLFCGKKKKGRYVVQDISTSMTNNALYINQREGNFLHSPYHKFPDRDLTQMEQGERYSLPRQTTRQRTKNILPETEAGVSPPPDTVIPPAHDFFNFNRARCHSTLHDANWQYPRNQLVYMRELGEGQFGKVLLMKAQSIAGYSGQLPVAVKTLSSRDPEMVRKFMEEAELMKKFSHPNIISLLGISTDDVHDEDNAPLMILEYMPYGDLHAFLRKYRPNSQAVQPVLTHSHFIHFAMDVAKALEFMVVLKYVHRDIAARNCLVGTGLRIKISDFGLARKVNAQNIYKLEGNSVLPIRTMAPECFLSGVFTPASDVWSYGVLLWEIATFGAIPLPGLSSQDIADQAQTGQLYHVIPPECPPVLSSLISQCHTHDPDQRPSFTDILEKLTAELSSVA